MEAYQLDCDFCESTVRAAAVDRLKTRAKTHLETNHYEDVLAVLDDTHDEVSCHNDCGHVLSVETDGEASLDCPRCGFDNLSPLVGQYVYWQIERK
ncbi:hypothetical protein [Halorussus salinisoli]|uniref:hypothetical protein n=1 Tax=Halorussus salinisoli TaxID=2558242 RepID=UPI0010C209B2|nr:hypothetical protein [Halorussus salinisoli]